MDLYPSEAALLSAFVEAVVGLDPDILLGYEIQKASLGYLAERAAGLGVPLLRRVSRLPEVCAEVMGGSQERSAVGV